MMRCIASCKLGLERIVREELQALGIEVLETLDARVRFCCGPDALARALLWLRTAERVFLEVGVFEAKSFDALFEGVRALPWREYLPQDANIHVNGKSAKSTLFSVSDCQSITKKAIVESLRAGYGVRELPETGAEVIIEVGLLRDEATLALDAAGAGLSRRGYRTWNVPAPISETLGAAIVLLSRHRPEQPFLDPMCGSGTLPIEAAMIAQRRAPGLNRAFAAERWSFLPRGTFDRAREEARDSILDLPIDIEGADIDAHSIDLCKKHAKKAGVMLRWAVRPVKDLARTDSGGLLACNPPYGERLMSKREAADLYREMRRAFDTLDAWRISIITAQQDFERIYGQRANYRRKLSNGGMACTLYQYLPPKE